MNERTTERAVSQPRLDAWRAFAEQTRTDLFTVRRLIASGQGAGAAQLIGGMLDSAIMAGLDMEEAGAARPSTLPPKPTAGTGWTDLDEA